MNIRIRKSNLDTDPLLAKRIVERARSNWHHYIEAKQIDDPQHREVTMARHYAATMTALSILHILRGDTIVHPSLTTSAIRNLNS